MSPQKSERFFAAMALALSMALVGANVPLAKVLGAEWPVFWIGFWRALIATIALAPFLALERRRRSSSDEPRKARPLSLALLGLSGVVLYPTLILFGLAMTSATAAGAITATIPAAIALLAFLVLGERVSPKLRLSILVAIAGLVAINLSAVWEAEPGAVSAEALLGNMLILAAVFSEASYVILARRLAAGYAPVEMAFFANLVASCAFVPVLLWAGGSAAVVSAPLWVWAGVAFYALTSSIIALILWFWGIRRIPAANAGIFTVFLPVTATLIAVLWLGERLSLVAGLGLVFVILAILIAPGAEETPRTRRGDLPLG